MLPLTSITLHRLAINHMWSTQAFCRRGKKILFPINLKSKKLLKSGENRKRTSVCKGIVSRFMIRKEPAKERVHGWMQLISGTEISPNTCVNHTQPRASIDHMHQPRASMQPSEKKQLMVLEGTVDRGKRGLPGLSGKPSADLSSSPQPCHVSYVGTVSICHESLPLINKPFCFFKAAIFETNSLHLPRNTNLNKLSPRGAALWM